MEGGNVVMEERYPHVFTPVRIENNILRNRIICPPSMPHYHQGPEKYPADAIITHFANRAKGGAALVTCSGTKVYPKTGVTAHFQSCDIFDAQSQNYLSMMADAVHFYGAKCSIILDSPVRAGYDVSAGIDPYITKGEGETPPEGNKELPIEMIDGIVEEYARQCEVFQDCGFDAAFLHFAYTHYFPSRFLSPLTNKRTDEFGGSLENRAKLALMIFDRIKQRCGKDFIIEASLTAQEPEGGMTLEDTAEFLRLADGHVDIIQLRAEDIDISQPVNFILDPTPHRDVHRRLKEMVGETSILFNTVGGYHDLSVVEEILANKEADLVAMARPIMCNPNLLNMAREGREDDIIPCLRCNKCHVPSTKGPYLSICSVNPELGYEHKLERMITPPERKKRVAIVGGGPGGMKSAMVCADRGHDVTLYEKSGELGGLLKISDHCDFKWTMKKFKDFLIYQIGKKGINVKLNTTITKEMLLSEGYDEVIIAIGAHPVIPQNLPGADGANVFTAPEVYGIEDSLAEDVVVIGGGEIGAETGLHLSKAGHKVTVIEMKDTLAAEAAPIHYRAVFEEEWEKEPNFHYVLKAVCTGIAEDGVTYKDMDGAEHKIPAGSVVIAIGMNPNIEEAMALCSPSYQYRFVGDCNKVGSIQTTMRSALGEACQV